MQARNHQLPITSTPQRVNRPIAWKITWIVIFFLALNIIVSDFAKQHLLTAVAIVMLVVGIFASLTCLGHRINETNEEAFVEAK